MGVPWIWNRLGLSQVRKEFNQSQYEAQIVFWCDSWTMSYNFTYGHIWERRWFPHVNIWILDLLKTDGKDLPLKYSISRYFLLTSFQCKVYWILKNKIPKNFQKEISECIVAKSTIKRRQIIRGGVIAVPTAPAHLFVWKMLQNSGQRSLVKEGKSLN